MYVSALYHAGNSWIKCTTDGHRRVVDQALPGLMEAEEAMLVTSGQQPTTGSKNPADAVKRVLTAAGITGAALTLSAAAALPAFAGHDGGKGDDAKHGQSHGSQSSSHSHSQPSHSSQSHDSGTTKPSSGHSDKSKTQGDKSHGANSDEGHNPPGNNGTVKIHQTAGDSSPHNQPHVSCSFYVSFFGFDKDQPLGISFTGQAPTGKGTPIAITDESKRSLTSTTDAGGAGNDYDGDQGAFSASNLDLSGITPVKQGYHIKLDVSTGQGGGHKYKVFWLTPCAGTTPPVGGTTGGTTGGGTTGGGTTGGTTPEVGGTGAVTGGTTGQGASVLGESFTKGAMATGAQVLGASVSRGGSSGLAALPFTGAEIGAMSALGLAALGGGAALTVAGRRRRRAVRSM